MGGKAPGAVQTRVRAILSRELSAEEAVQATLEAIHRVDADINAFTAVSSERALADARALDHRLACGEEAGPRLRRMAPARLLTPSMTAAPPRRLDATQRAQEEGEAVRVQSLNPFHLANLTGQPALVLPRSGLDGPDGIQLVGRPFVDDDLIALAVTLEPELLQP